MSLEQAVVSILFALLPAALVVGVVTRGERRAKGTAYLAYRAFLYGFLAVAPAAILALLVGRIRPPDGSLVADLFRAFVISGAVEEALKLFVLQVLVAHSPFFVAEADGVRSAVAVAVGFALFENLLYGFGRPEVMFIRTLTAVPLHVGAAGILGYVVGRHAFHPRVPLMAGYAPAVLIHGAYNFVLFTPRLPVLLSAGIAFLSAAAVVPLYLRARDRDRRMDRPA